MDHASASTEPTAPPGRGLDPQKRHAILEAAQDVFLRDGFAAASMDDVARVAGVGKMTVYRHFGSKNALFRDMLREVCGGVFFRGATPPGATLEDELPRLGRAFLELITDPHRLNTYRLAMAEGERNPDLSRMFYEGAVVPVIEGVAERLRAHAPGLDRSKASELAALFLHVVQGTGYMRLLMGLDRTPDHATFDRQIATATEIVAERVRRAS